MRQEYGINMADQRPRHLDTVADRRFDHVISLCDKVQEACPDFPDDPRRPHWSIPDPATAGDADQTGYPAFRRTAAEINTRIRYYCPSSTRRRLTRDIRPVRQRPLHRR
jgi:protein-tyrosine-phosphatase